MVNKVAVMTDIHGNAPALHAVLHDISQRGNIEHIYCAGDLVSIGSDTNEVLDLICSVPNISCVMGNHDQYVLAIATGRDPGVKGGVLADYRILKFPAGGAHRRLRFGHEILGGGMGVFVHTEGETGAQKLPVD